MHKKGFIWLTYKLYIKVNDIKKYNKDSFSYFGFAGVDVLSLSK